MLRRILDWFRLRRSDEIAAHSGYTSPSFSERAATRLTCDAESSGDAAKPTGFENTSTENLMAICEAYWDYLAQPRRPGIEGPVDQACAGEEARDHYHRYVCAANELGNRELEIQDWARRLLRHPDYEACEIAAWWIGQLGIRGQLDAVEDVVDELEALVNRPVGEESKERQAVDAAITAIGKIGHPKGLPVLRRVLFSTEWYHKDDTEWAATDALGKLIGRRFMDEPDPVGAARAWLQSHPDHGRKHSHWL
jgi:hypothetical protein